MLKFDRIYEIPCDPFAFPFINRHKGRFHEVIHCYNLGKKGVPPYVMSVSPIE